jgi:hypothetical protein
MTHLIHTALIAGLLATPMIALAGPAAKESPKAGTLTTTAGHFGACVTDETGNKSALWLQKQDQVTILGKDVLGVSLPLQVVGDEQDSDYTSGKTWGRLVRLGIGAAGWNNFYDIGLDKAGNLFINSKSSTATQHVLTITPSGDVVIQGNLTVKGKINP